MDLRALAVAVALYACGPALTGCRPDRGHGDGRVTIRFVEEASQEAAWRDAIARFEAREPGIHVEFVPGPSSADAREDMYATAFLSGDDTYDLVLMDVIWTAKFAAQGWILPLDDRLDPQARADLLPVHLASLTHAGRVYGLPLRAGAGLLFYRRDLIDHAPETFSELTAVAQRLARPGMVGFAYQGFQYEGLVCTFLEVLWGHGGDVLDGNGAVILDQPQGLAALRWLASTVGSISPEGVATWQEEESRQSFQEGHALLLRNWPYVWRLSQEPDSPVRGKVAVGLMPHAPGEKSASTFGGSGFAIASSSRHREAAWRFIQFAASRDEQRTWFLRAGFPPASRALYQDAALLAQEPLLRDVYRALQVARPRPVHPRYARISDELQLHVSAALVGLETPEEAVARAARTLRAVVGR